MEVELRILDFIQSLRTPFGDVAMPFISKLGNTGMIWIILALVLLINLFSGPFSLPRTADQHAGDQEKKRRHKRREPRNRSLRHNARMHDNNAQNPYSL